MRKLCTGVPVNYIYTKVKRSTDTRHQRSSMTLPRDHPVQLGCRNEWMINLTDPPVPQNWIQSGTSYHNVQRGGDPSEALPDVGSAADRRRPHTLGLIPLWAFRSKWLAENRRTLYIKHTRVFNKTEKMEKLSFVWYESIHLPLADEEKSCLNQLCGSVQHPRTHLFGMLRFIS